MKFLTASVLAALVFLSGCSTMDPNAGSQEKTGETFGAILGAGLGIILGEAVDCHGCALGFGLAGAGIGSQVGRSIGRSMDQEDRAILNASINNNSTGQKTIWKNPDTQTQYSVTPTRTFQGPSAQPCREVIIGEKKVNGESQEVYTTACYDGAGGWNVQPK